VLNSGAPGATVRRSPIWPPGVTNDSVRPGSPLKDARTSTVTTLSICRPPRTHTGRTSTTRAATITLDSVASSPRSMGLSVAA
jgi:hypothetical protein